MNAEILSFINLALKIPTWLFWNKIFVKPIDTYAGIYYVEASTKLVTCEYKYTAKILKMGNMCDQMEDVV